MPRKEITSTCTTKTCLLSVNKLEHPVTHTYILRDFQSASELYRPSDRRISVKLVPSFAEIGYRVVSATDSHGRYSKCHVTSNKAPLSYSNPAHSLWWEEFLNTRSSTSHTLESTPLSEVCLLRIQGYSWPCNFEQGPAFLVKSRA
jgi:hypothetical protein